VVAALAAARELPHLSLEDALELTMLIARKDSSRYPRGPLAAALPRRRSRGHDWGGFAGRL